LVWDVGTDYYNDAEGKGVVEGRQTGVLLDRIAYWFEDEDGGFGAGHRLDATSIDARTYPRSTT
jgi:hypothetical protein